LKRYRVELSPEALGHAQHVRAWWRENREAAPDLFVDELGQTLQKLEHYIVVEDPGTVRVHAIWHMARIEPLV
jgi:hypothetical protein